MPNNFDTLSLSNTKSNSKNLFNTPIVPQSNIFQTGVTSSFFTSGGNANPTKQTSYNFDNLSLSNTKGGSFAPPPVTFDVDYSATTNDNEPYVADEETEETEEKKTAEKKDNTILYVSVGVGVVILGSLIVALTSNPKAQPRRISLNTNQ